MGLQSLDRNLCNSQHQSATITQQILRIKKNKCLTTPPCHSEEHTPALFLVSKLKKKHQILKRSKKDHICKSHATRAKEN